MPSRPMGRDASSLTVKGVTSGSRVNVALTQRGGARQATGSFTIEAADKTMTIAATRLGMLQAADGWSALTGMARVAGAAEERAFVAMVDRRDPGAPGTATLVLQIEGEAPWRGVLPRGAVSSK